MCRNTISICDGILLSFWSIFKLVIMWDWFLWIFVWVTHFLHFLALCWFQLMRKIHSNLESFCVLCPLCHRLSSPVTTTTMYNIFNGTQVNICLVFRTIAKTARLEQPASWIFWNQSHVSSYNISPKFWDFPERPPHPTPRFSNSAFWVRNLHTSPEKAIAQHARYNGNRSPWH